VTQKVR